MLIQPAGAIALLGRLLQYEDYYEHGKSKGDGIVTCRFDLDEKVTVLEQGEYYAMTGIIIDRRAGGMVGMPGF